MPISSSITNSFRLEALQGIHLAAHTYNLALFLAAAALDTATTTYTGAASEVPAGGGYATGGIALTGAVYQLFGNVACLDFTDPVWNPSTIATARGFLIYNATLAGKNSVMTYNFGADYTSTNGPFTADLPAPGAATSLIQWA
jgi:hypothetical protein